MILGLCGAAGSGKSTVASRLHLTHGFASWAFADPLYEAVAAITGIPAEDLRDRTVKEREIPWVGASPRRLLQTLGTEWGRQMVSDTIWIDSTFRRIERSEWTNHVICDVRFENEAAAIRSRGGLIVLVCRPGSGCLDREAAGHSSEAGLPEGLIDATISNNGPIEELHAAVDAVFRMLQEDTMR